MIPKTRLLGCSLWLALLFGHALAEQRTLVIPLDTFAGTYVVVPKQDVSRTTYLSYERPTQVTGARLHLVGTAVPGGLSCTPGGIGDPGVNFLVYVAYPSTGDYRFAFSTSLRDLTAFDLELDLASFDRDAVVAILASGHCDVRLWASPGIMSDCGLVPPYPEATVTADTLTIDGDFSVPTAPTAWSAVQALFR